jgi:hypothetical protein
VLGRILPLWCPSSSQCWDVPISEETYDNLLITLLHFCRQKPLTLCTKPAVDGLEALPSSNLGIVDNQTLRIATSLRTWSKNYEPYLYLWLLSRREWTPLGLVVWKALAEDYTQWLDQTFLLFQQGFQSLEPIGAYLSGRDGKRPDGMTMIPGPRVRRCFGTLPVTPCCFSLKSLL